MCKSRIGDFGQPESSRSEEGGEWKNEAWADLRSERRIKSQFQGVGVRAEIFGRLNGLALGIYNRLVAGGRFSGKRISARAQWRLNALIFGGGYPDTSWFLYPTRSISTHEAMVRMRIRFLQKTPRFRGSLHISGNCAWWRRRQH